MATTSGSRLHPAYTEALLQLAAEGMSPRDAINAVTNASAAAFTSFFRDRVRSARNFKIMVQEIMILPTEIEQRVKEAYPEDEHAGFDVREHVIEMVESTEATEATDSTQLVVNWKSMTLKGRQPNVSKWPLETAGRMLAQLILRPKNGYSITAPVLIERLESSNQFYLRRASLSTDDTTRLFELYRAVANGERETMVQRITLLNPFLQTLVQDLQAWRTTHRSVLHTIWADREAEVGSDIDALV